MHKSIIPPAALLPVVLLFAVACRGPKETVAFSDEADIRAEAASAVQTAAQPRLSREDELAIEQTIFSYLLERHFWDLDYSAVFLQADDAQVAGLIKKYPNHVPPIKPTALALIESHKLPLDKTTKKPAMILSVEVDEPNADGSVNAIGRWYAGDAATGFRAFNLSKADGQWQIVTVK
jgi:hypothetical protein